MKNKKFIRARSDEQKEVRIQEIVSATERLYETNRYEDITFVQIANEAGFTRSNLYKYFRSKEEIFLELLKFDFKVWKDKIISNFDKDKYSIDEFVKVWINTFESKKRLIELTSILYLHLEREASFDSLFNFKKDFVEDFVQVIGHLSGKITGFTKDLVAEFLNHTVVIGIGLHQMTDISENQKRILEMPEFSHWKIDFREQYIRVTKYILEGLLNK